MNEYYIIINIMENNNRNKLIQELKNSSFLPPFNEELYKGCT